jgi:glutathione S-transferase
MDLIAISKGGMLPIMEIDGHSQPLTQSGAMLRYIGRLKGGKLYPSSKVVEIEEILGLAADFDRFFTPSSDLVSFRNKCFLS